MQDERDAGVAQGVDAGADGELGLPSEGGDPVGVDAELVAEVELAGPAGQLDHVGRAVDRLEAAAGVALDEPGDVLVEHLVADPRRDHVDALLAVQDAGDVGVVEDVRRAGQAEGRARDDDRLGRPAAASSTRSGRAAADERRARRPVATDVAASRPVTDADDPAA